MLPPLRGSHLVLTFVARSGFSALTLAYWIDSLVRVTRRVSRSHFGRVSPGVPSGLAAVGTRVSLAGSLAGPTPAAKQTSPCLLARAGVPETAALLRSKPLTCSFAASGRPLVTTARPINCSSTASFSTVSSLLTLFSKFFSSFLRSTSSLSVSRLYLALEEVYLPFRAAFPNNPTLRSISYARALPTTGL